MSTMTRTSAHVLVILACACVGAIGAGFYAWSGLYDVAASTGHSPPVSWFLHAVMRRSVHRHAADIRSIPDLDDQRLIVRGAAHYQSGCAPCHGAPYDWRSIVERNATPPPPPYAAILESWSP